MQNEDFYKPTSIRDSIFASIDLPEQSGIQSLSQKYKNQKQKIKADKYGQEQDEDGDSYNDLGFSMLGQVSKVQPKVKYESPMSIIEQVSDMKKQSSNLTRANSSQKQTSPQKSETPKITLGKKPVQQVRRANLKGRDTKNINKNEVKQKKVVDIDTEIGQVKEWAYRQENEKESDFDKSDEQEPYQITTNKQVQDQLRRKAEQKVKILQKKIENKNYSSQPKGLGLKAKAQELRKKNQQNNSVQVIKPKILQKIEHEQSSDNLKVDLAPQLNSKLAKNSNQVKKQTNQQKISQQQQQEQSEDDPWQKINQKTKKDYQKKQEIKASPISKQQVIEFYTKKFIFDEEDIIVEFQLDQLQEQKVIGCWQMLFGCLKSDDGQDNKKSGHKKHKDRTAMRLVAISKINLSNTEEQFFILKEIWVKLTNKAFSRYGNHWNEIGFQGRDPATDLRSTGILSLLQWYLFLQEDFKSAKSIFDWTKQNDFPLALTHIKATGMFLKLVKNGKIKTSSWNQYQKYYNCIVSEVFTLIKKSYDPSDNIGQTVDKNLQLVKKNLSSKFQSYSKQKQVSK